MMFTSEIVLVNEEQSISSFKNRYNINLSSIQVLFKEDLERYYQENNSYMNYDVFLDSIGIYTIYDTEDFGHDWKVMYWLFIDYAWKPASFLIALQGSGSTNAEKRSDPRHAQHYHPGWKRTAVVSTVQWQDS